MARRKGTVTVETVEPTQQVTDAAPAGQPEAPAAETTVETDTKETERPVTDADVATLTAKQQEGVKAGNIRASWAEVIIKDGASPTGKGGSRPYLRLEALNAMGLAQVFDGKIEPQTQAPKEGDDTRTDVQKMKGACDFANYGYDLERRRVVREALMDELSGPEKAVKKAVIGALGMDYSPAEVRTFVMNSPKFKGVDGLERIIDAALKAAS